MSKQKRAFELFAEGLGPKDPQVIDLELKPDSIRKYYQIYQNSLNEPVEPIEDIEPVEPIEPVEMLIRAIDAEDGSTFVATIPDPLGPKKVTLRKISQLGPLTRCLQITPRLGISIPGTSLVKPI